MRYFGLIGYPLSHSFSKKFFTEKFEREGIRDCQYDNYPLENIGLFPELVTGITGLSGLNVTIPYKQKVLTYMNELDDEIELIGAVNTIKIIGKGDRKILVGYNTDVFGFRKCIEPYIKREFTDALILGTGGSSRAVAYVLRGMGLNVMHVSRSPSATDHISYDQLDRPRIMKSNIIVNASPVGMYPRVGEYPAIPYEFLTPDHVLFDLIYNPEETIFLKWGKQKGAQIINGLPMLHLQAERSWYIWNET